MCLSLHRRGLAWAHPRASSAVAQVLEVAGIFLLVSLLIAFFQRHLYVTALPPRTAHPQQAHMLTCVWGWLLVTPTALCNEQQQAV